MRKEASVYLGIFSVSSIKNTFNKLFFFLRIVKKPFGGSSWLLLFSFILDFYDFIFALLVCVWGGGAWGLLIFLAFFAVGWGCCSWFFFSATPPMVSAWRCGYQNWGAERGREEQKSAGSGFQGDSGPLGAGEE